MPATSAGMTAERSFLRPARPDDEEVFPSSWPSPDLIRGLAQPSTSCFTRAMGGWVYIMSNRPDGTLYVGVASDLPRRAYQHREGLVEGFTKRHGLKRLVYYEPHDDIRNAIQREKTVKHWPRAWKVRLIHSMNPDWEDLYDKLF